MSRITLRNLIISSVLLVAALGVFGYMLLASERQTALLEEQLIALEKKRAQEESYIQMRRIVDESFSDRELLAGMFVTKESDSIDFLNLVESLAENKGIALETTVLEVVEDKKAKTTSLDIGFSFNGPKDDVSDFITVLESLRYLAEIRKVDFKARSSTNWIAEVTMSVNLYEYAE